MERPKWGRSEKEWAVPSWAVRGGQHAGGNDQSMHRKSNYNGGKGLTKGGCVFLRPARLRAAGAASLHLSPPNIKGITL